MLNKLQVGTDWAKNENDSSTAQQLDLVDT